MRVFALPQHERSSRIGDGSGGIGGAGRIGETGVDEALGITEIRGEKNVKGRAILDLRCECGGGLESGLGVNAGGALKLRENGRKYGLKIGGGGNAEGRLRFRMRCLLAGKLAPSRTSKRPLQLSLKTQAK